MFIKTVQVVNVLINFRMDFDNFVDIYSSNASLDIII